MDFLKRIPIHYKGELHDVRLVNFTVEMHEVRNDVPPQIKIRDFNGRAMISMVDVKLKHMRPVVMPLLQFNYRHIAFRLLVEDSMYNGGATKGIFFLRSFTDKPLIVSGGKILTHYNLESATIAESDHRVVLTRAGKHVTYSLGTSAVSDDPDLYKTIGALDRAYAVLGNSVRVTEIRREKWPIEAVNCTDFENTFFETAKLEGAFKVREVIFYHWLPSKSVML